MRARQQSLAIANGTEHRSSRLTLAMVDSYLVLIRSKNFHFAAFDRRCIDKHPASVIVRGDFSWDIVFKGTRRSTQPHQPRTPLTVVLEALEGAPTACPREEAQLAAPDDLEGPVADLELTPATGVVASGAEAQVRPAAPHEFADAAIALAVEDPAVAEIGASGNDEESTGRPPGLLQDGGLIDRYDGVVGSQELSQCVDTMPHRLGRCPSA